MDKREILKQHIGKIVTVTDEQLDYFVSHFEEHAYKKGQVIIGEGDKVDKEYFVLSGCLKAFYITDAEVLSLSNADREKICREIHAIEHFFRWRTNRGYVASQRRLLSFMNSDAKARYEELMRMYPELYNIVPKHLIAAYLGVSRETLSRLYQHHTHK
jgi:CRP-like cAMP-binding protein